jgi:hypothetical protein
VKRFISPHPLVADLADRAFRAGVPMSDVSRRSGRHPSTWSRYAHHGIRPDLTVLESLERALTEIIQENDSGEKG